MKQSTKLTLSADLYQIPTIMRNMLTDGRTALASLVPVIEDIENMLDNSDYGEAADTVMKFREKLYRIDVNYEDLATLLISYIEAMTELHVPQAPVSENQGEEIDS